MNILLFALSLSAFAEGQLHFGNLNFYERATGYCSEKEAASTSHHQKKWSEAEKKYSERVAQDVCRIQNLQSAVKQKTPPPLCKEASSKDKSACFIETAERIHAKQPFNASAVVLMGAMQVTFIMNERKELKAAKGSDFSSLETSRKLLNYVVKAQRMLRSPPTVKAVVGREDPELEKVLLETAADSCARLRKVGTNLLADISSKPEMLKALAKEKSEFEAEPDCEAAKK